MLWPRLTTQEIKHRIFDALKGNLNYRSEKILGIPASYLDQEIFYEDAPFLKEAPFLSALIANPNHIGCHTLEGEKEPIFKGTQAIEKDLIRICAEEIFGAKPNEYDGYVASGGTEANIEAVWIYRNYFVKEKKAALDQIALVYSEDSHYSFPKAADLLGLNAIVFKVDENSRAVNKEDLHNKIIEAQKNGVKYFIVNANLSTTMFGSIDDVDTITDIFLSLKAEFKLHVDGAFGGFICPFTDPNSKHNFRNPHVGSVTIDGHKMLQSPYGTGIFLIRKNMIGYVCTEQASYVQGKDYTLVGSRSGANAVSVWMILHKHGSVGWGIKMHELLDKTSNLCTMLGNLGIGYYRNPYVNIITIRASFVSPSLAKQFMLVPDDHHDPKWYKIVVMPHVKQGVLDEFISHLSNGVMSKK